MRCVIMVGTMLLVLCGCAGSPIHTVKARSSAHDGPQDCFDGVCTIRVAKGTTFALDADSFGLNLFTVTALGPDGIECELYVRPRGAFTLTLKKPGQSTAAELGIATWVTLVSMDATTAVIALTHVTPP